MLSDTELLRTADIPDGAKAVAEAARARKRVADSIFILVYILIVDYMVLGEWKQRRWLSQGQIMSGDGTHGVRDGHRTAERKANTSVGATKPLRQSILLGVSHNE